MGTSVWLGFDLSEEAEEFIDPPYNFHHNIEPERNPEADQQDGPDLFLSMAR